MELTIIVSDETKSALEQRAQERGYRDVSKYVERLISTDLLAAKSFDDILAPIRKTFQESGMADDELEALFEEAREVLSRPKIRKRHPEINDERVDALIKRVSEKATIVDDVQQHFTYSRDPKERIKRKGFCHAPARVIRPTAERDENGETATF